MYELIQPWMLLLLPLPIIVNRVLPAYRKREVAIRAPFFEKLVNLSGELPRRGAVVSDRPLYRTIMLILIWFCIVIAAARPQYIGAPIKYEKSARDLMVAVDLSGSMEERDFVSKSGIKVDRLTALKSVLKDFIVQREHDRLGLIVFGDSPFLQAPFTQDHQAWLTLLNETQIAMAGMSTSLGDAIGLAIKLFRENESQNRVLIVLTDGNDTGSRVPPVEAAKVAKEYGVTIYPIAIGDPETLGEEALDSDTLERVAQITDGVFYHALNRAQLNGIYQHINELEPQKFDTQSHRPRRDLHHIPMSVATLIMFAFMLINVWQANASFISKGK